MLAVGAVGHAAEAPLFDAADAPIAVPLVRWERAKFGALDFLDHQVEVGTGAGDAEVEAYVLRGEHEAAPARVPGAHAGHAARGGAHAGADVGAAAKVRAVQRGRQLQLLCYPVASFVAEGLVVTQKLVDVATGRAEGGVDQEARDALLFGRSHAKGFEHVISAVVGDDHVAAGGAAVEGQQERIEGFPRIRMIGTPRGFVDAFVGLVGGLGQDVQYVQRRLEQRLRTRRHQHRRGPDSRFQRCRCPSHELRAKLGLGLGRRLRLHSLGLDTVNLILTGRVGITTIMEDVGIMVLTYHVDEVMACTGNPVDVVTISTGHHVDVVEETRQRFGRQVAAEVELGGNGHGAKGVVQLHLQQHLDAAGGDVGLVRRWERQVKAHVHLVATIDLVAGLRDHVPCYTGVRRQVGHHLDRLAGA
eukprot:scaffold302_cov247-Pinguiococcus_pyrenoidosus.AAC.31